MPTTVVETVRRKTDTQCHATTCREGGCSLSLRGVPKPNVLISLEHPASPVNVNQARCDYLFVGGEDGNDGPWVAPIELTASAARVSKFLPQLRAGAAVAERLVPQGARVQFRPVAVYGGELRRIERDNFLKSANQVSFRNQKQKIRLVRCRSPLTKALK